MSHKDTDTMILGQSFVLNEVNELSPVIEYCQRRNLNALQFSINPSTITDQPQKIGTALKMLLSTVDISIVYHGKYLYNFCRAHVENQKLSLIQEIRTADQIGCPVVIHQGKNVESEGISKLEAINNYVTNLTEVLDETHDSQTILLLENSAGQGTELGYSLEELSYIYHQFDDQHKERIGFCLDTCHAFVAGTCDFRNSRSSHTFPHSIRPNNWHSSIEIDSFQR